MIHHMYNSSRNMTLEHSTTASSTLSMFPWTQIEIDKYQPPLMPEPPTQIQSSERLTQPPWFSFYKDERPWVRWLSPGKLRNRESHEAIFYVPFLNSAPEYASWDPIPQTSYSAGKSVQSGPSVAAVQKLPRT